MDNWLIIDLGGSIIAPSEAGPDVEFSAEILQFLYRWLDENPRHCLGLIVGGGAPARLYQQAVPNAAPSDALDWLGIRATHLNGEYLRLLIMERQENLLPLLTQYEELPAPEAMGRMVVGGGWKPGFSTDYDAVLLAEHVGAGRLLCLSNIAQIYDDDPKTNPAAKPLAELSWAAYREIVGTEWRPGRSMPFDPVATAHASKIGLELVFADGRNLDNLECILSGQSFVGTVVC